MKRRELLPIFVSLLLIASLGALPAYAQTGEITGTVTDSTNGNPLPGVNVIIAETQQGASTDAQGTYTISNVDPGTYDLQASFVGYQQRTIPDVTVSAGETVRVNFRLMPGTIELEEVVAVGYGTQQEGEVTGSISSVGSEDFIEGAARDAGELIEDQVAGLNISQSSGDPRGGSNISLRGTTTLEAPSEPLILIDGVPGDLETVAPQNIESVDVLKGGAAAAIYGSRASNGVVLISTKQQEGADGGITSIEYSGNVSYEQINSRPDFLSADQLRNRMEEYPEQLQHIEDFGHNTDWQEEVLRNPVSYQQHLAVAGGDRSTNYRASFDYENRQGIFQRSDNEEIFGRASVNHSMLDGALQVDANASGRIETSWNGLDNGLLNPGANLIWRQAIERNPTDRVKTEDGEWQERPGDNYFNPVGLLEETNGEDENRELRLDGTLTWSPINSLTLSLLGSTTRFSRLSQYSETFNHISTTKNGLDGVAERETFSNVENLLELTGTYEDEIGSHSFELLGGYSWQDDVEENFVSRNEDFPTDAFGSNNMQIGNALTDGEAAIESSKQRWKLIGFFGRVNYNYDNRYLLMASLRYEGNSKFGENHKWGSFPAVSLGWRIGEESFMDDVAFVDALKLRGGYGVTGIAPEDPYQSLASFSYGGSFFNNGEWVQGLEPSRNANPELRWEEKIETNIGLDFTLFNQRLSGTVDVYRRTTDDLLFDLSVPVPPYLFDTITANVGKMRNEGIEASLEYNVVQTGDVNYTMNTTFSTNRNELVSLSGDQFQTENDFFYTGGIGGPVQRPTTRIEVGESVGNFYGFKSVGVNEEGRWMIETAEGDVIPWTEVEPENRQVLGNGVPNYRLSWNHSLRVGNFDARVAMGGEFGFQILNITRLFYETPGNNSNNYLEGAFDEIDGQLLRNREDYVSHYVEDGDYWKIENVTLGYSFGSALNSLPGLGSVSTARVYVTGRNLVTFTGYEGIDPEVDTSGLTPGVDSRFKYPTTRTFTVGLNLTL